MEPLISVITPGRHRTSTLDRCVAAVAQQEGVNVEHILASDCCPVFYRAASRLAATHDRISAITRHHDDSVSSGYMPARAAATRNLGVLHARGEYIAFLDDDNAWETQHLASLMRLLQDDASLGAAYSLRTLWTAEGTPYRSEWHPWTDTEDGALRYQHLRELGVYVPGTNLMNDIVTDTDSTENSICTVDTSAWLLRKSVAVRFPFPVLFTPTDELARVSEDVLFCENLLSAGVSIRSSGLHTLRYYLGGFSTNGDSKWGL